MALLGLYICCNRVSTGRSSGSKKRATPFLPHRTFAAALASAYALRGETERAAAELAEARRLNGGDLFSSIAHLKAYRWQSWLPKIRALFDATYFAGLRKAGMPEE